METERRGDGIQFNWLNVGRAVLLLPALVLMALTGLILQAFGGGKARRTPEDVAQYLRDFIEGTGGERDWDDFESVPIADPRLDAIRRSAAKAGPPGADLEQLRLLLVRAERIARETPHPSAFG
jgi:hypothetical protein